MGQPMLSECIGIRVLSPAHECETRGFLVYLLIIKYVSILFKTSQSTLDWTALSWKFLGIFIKHFRGVVYRDYKANRRSFIYCSLACTG